MSTIILFAFAVLSLINIEDVSAVNLNQKYGFGSYRTPAPSPTPLLREDFSNYRVFHPAFPSSVRESLTHEEAAKILKLKETLSNEQEAAVATNAIAARLPWKLLPQVGVLDGQNSFSRAQLQDAYLSNRHHGALLWAHKLSKVERGAVLLNNWAQEAVQIISYSPEHGAEGIEIVTNTGIQPKVYKWPPLALDFEIAENRWQPIAVSPVYQEMLNFLQAFPKGAWELAFMLLLTKEDQEINQALFDTGLCPQQGLIAYLRIIDQLHQRTEQWNDVPQHRKITERDILKQ